MSRALYPVCRIAFVIGALALGACTEDEPTQSTADPAELEELDEVDGALSIWQRMCHEDSDCRRGHVCDFRGCDAERGQCVQLRDACDDAWRPQCGCDGVTYRNQCERVRAGAALAHRGVCEQVCGGIQGLTCDRDEVCLFEVGSCGDGDQQGMCVDRPEACPDVWEPVCGCDGQTYSNRCDALAAGVSIRHKGECEVECKNNDFCHEGQFCLKASCDEAGVCERRPDICPLDAMPVCGCDRQTYMNRCGAHAAGVSVAYEGQCRGAGSCIDDTQCAEGEFCEQPWCGVVTVADTANALWLPPGQCVDIPEVCTEQYEPVCGCDGVTYSNDCFRRAAGVSKLHDGVCERPGCWTNDQCADTEYCVADTCGGHGRCEPRPDVSECPDFREPVCGCDGNTYDNKCFAAYKGTTVAHSGECLRECGGPSGGLCEEGEFCDPRPGTCAIAAPINALVAPWPPGGVCVDIPGGCPDIWQPVCGCDNKTYSSDCDRIVAGVAKLHDGACEEQRCEDNSQCHEGDYCQKAGCHGVGTCEHRPEGCERVWEPVCGCDGKTYGNKCEAAHAGVNVAHEGECVQVCGGITGAPCEEGEFCDPPAGQCDWSDVQGVCVEQGDYCPLVYKPVCGCDGKTYSNDCFRIGAGVAADHEGRCSCDVPACDIWCPFGYVLDEEGCATCECREPPIEHCCDPNEKPGSNDNPICFAGASCCSDGGWRCNHADGSSSCGDADATGAASPTGPGRVCEACCDPAMEPGNGEVPACFEGATCCASGKWLCNDEMARPTCEVLGQVCECPARRCLHQCYWGYKKDDNGCDTCECNPPPIEACCDPARAPGHDGNPPCFEGASCCPDGTWQCNNADGTASCERPWASAETDANTDPGPVGVVCEACCEGGPNQRPACIEGSTCCPDGKWYCNEGDGSDTCPQDFVGQACCAPVVCTLACENGFAKGPDGCEICECNPPVCGPIALPLCETGYELVAHKDEHGCTFYTCEPIECPQFDCLTCEWGNKKDERGCETCECLPEPCCDPAKESCGTDANLCPVDAVPTPH